MFSIDLGSDDCGGHAIVALRGELDLVDAAAAAAALRTVAARQPRIIVDLTRLEFIDASGVAALSHGRVDARNAGGDLVLAAPQQRVRRVLTIIWEAGDAGLPSSVAEAAGIAGDPQRPVVPIHRQPTRMRWQRVVMSARAWSDARLPEAG
jgi:anti-sigma B factor antagonist